MWTNGHYGVVPTERDMDTMTKGDLDAEKQADIVKTCVHNIETFQEATWEHIIQVRK